MREGWPPLQRRGWPAHMIHRCYKKKLLGVSNVRPELQTKVWVPSEEEEEGGLAAVRYPAIVGNR